MKKIALYILIFLSPTLYSQNKIYSKEFIESRINLTKNESIIKAKYTDEFVVLMKELMSLSWFEKAVSMTDYYFPLFDKKALKYDVPTDLKYIAVIESGLRPKIRSSAGATGLFQFMEGTGNIYGLKENKYINLFHDVVANTDCAMRYFKELNLKYDDWKFALASYNYGFGNVNRKIKISGSNNFNVVYNYFPRETRNYINRFLVTKYLIENKDIYFPNRKRFKYVFTDFKMIRVQEATTIKKLARQYHKNGDLILFANPQLKTNYIPKGTIIYL